MHTDLTGKSAIVTGGSRGYGAGIARVLQSRGARVWITGRNAEALERTAGELGVQSLQADVTSPADWDHVCAAVLKTAGQLDILVNNAGAGVRIAPLAELTDAEIEQVVAVNLTGAVLGCRRVAPKMAEQGSGTIVNVSSVCQDQAWPGFSVYSAAKAGLAQLSKCLYTELREAGVRVTTVVPSWGATGFGEAAGLPKRDADIAARCIQPDELGTLVASICELPEHLNIQDVTLWPRVQEVVPL